MFKRIRYYIINNWQKAMLTTFFIFFSSILLLTMIFSRNISDSMMQKVKENLGAKVQIDFDMTQVTGADDYKQIPPLEDSSLENISKDTRIKEISYASSSYELTSQQIKRIVDTSIEGTGTIDRQYSTIHHFSIIGLDTWKNDEMKQKSMIVAGRNFMDEEINSDKKIVLISQQVAELNNLEIGDVINLRQEITNVDPAIGMTIEDFRSGSNGAQVLASNDIILEIVGIISPKLIIIDESLPERVKFDAYSENLHIKNDMYVPKGIITQLSEFDKVSLKEFNPDLYQEQLYYQRPIFILNSPDDVEGFITDNKEFLSGKYILRANMTEYKKLAPSLEHISNIVNKFIVVMIFIYFIILLALCWNYIRDRRKESAILLAIGEKKIRVILQYTSELSMLMLSGIVLAFGFVSLVGTNLGATFVEKQYQHEISNMNENDMTIAMYYGISAQDKKDIVKNALTVESFLIVALLMVITMLIIIIINILYIYRLSPRKILIE